MDRTITFVVMEPSSRLDEARRRRYEEIRSSLEGVAGRRVSAVHYLEVERLGPSPVVLSGAAGTWNEHRSADIERVGEAVLAAEAPILGICGGMQLLAQFAGGRVETMVPASREELGFLPLEVIENGGLFADLPARPIVYHDHRDEITDLPEGFTVLARTDACEIQAIAAPERRWWGTQFHPERFDDDHPHGQRVLANFFALAG